MMIAKRMKVGKSYIQATLIPLATKNLILLRGKKGYIMCGYLNLVAAEKFKDAAVKIIKVKDIKDALRAKAHSLTSAAKKMGIYKGQPIKEVLKIIS